MKKIVIFGTGDWGYRFFRSSMKSYEVVAFADNDVLLQGKDILGVPVVSPLNLLKISFDELYIAIANPSMLNAIRKQLMELGVDEKKIFEIDEESEIKTEKIHNDWQNIISTVSEFYCEEEFRDRTKEFENRWQKLKVMYQKIYIHNFLIAAIGELIMAYNSALYYLKSSRNDVLHIFLPKTFDGMGFGISNWYIWRMLNHSSFIFESEELLFWIYVITRHFKEDTITFKDMNIKTGMPSFMKKANNDLFRFSNEEIKYGENFLNKLFLKKYVCFAARTSAHKQKLVGGNRTDKFECNMIGALEVRNMDFSDYQLSIDLLNNNDIQSIRMGRGVIGEPINHCIDYASNYADEFLDWYLIANCQFAVVNSFGFKQMVSFMHKPVLTVNAYPLTIGYQGDNYTEYDRYIPQKMYDISKQRFLTIREMLKLEFDERKFNKPRSLEELGLKAIKNTPEEIAAATEEFYLQIMGKWENMPEDQRNEKRYEEIMEEFNEMVKQSPAVSSEHGPIPCSLSLTFMRTNHWILE